MFNHLFLVFLVAYAYAYMVGITRMRMSLKQIASSVDTIQFPFGDSLKPYDLAMGIEHMLHVRVLSSIRLVCNVWLSVGVIRETII